MIKCKSKMKLQKIVLGLGLAGLTASVSGQATNLISTDRYSIDSETVSNWSAPFRNWTYWPTPVIRKMQARPGATNILGTAVPTVFQIPGDEKLYMSFVAFDSKGYQSYIAESTNLVDWGN